MSLFKFSIFPENTQINFVSRRNIAVAMSIILMAASVVLFLSRGLNLGIDFTGGVLIEFSASNSETQEMLFNEKQLNSLRQQFSSENIGDVSLQLSDANRFIIVRIGLSDRQNQVSITEQAKNIITSSNFNNPASSATEPDIIFRKIDYVGPAIGDELASSGIWAAIVAFTMMMIYIWLRFEWHFGIGALAALIHDAVLTIGFFALTQIDFNLSTVIAILTVIGYSINDTVVIYDRVRENMRRFRNKELDDILNISINDTLSRTILTAGTTLLALLALVLFGGSVIYSFAIAVLFGVIIGTYSSVYVAAPVLAYMNVPNIAKLAEEEENKLNFEQV